MATTMLIEKMSFLKSLLLISLLAFPAANAIPISETENLCKETTNAAFCLQILQTDPRISAARDLSDVLVIAISQSKMQVDDATTYMGTITKKYSGPHGKRRIATCMKDYGIATARFQNAWELALKKKSFYDVNKPAKDGANAVIDCENVWRRGGPVQQSPLTLYNMNVFKISEIILLLIQKLSK